MTVKQMTLKVSGLKQQIFTSQFLRVRNGYRASWVPWLSVTHKAAVISRFRADPLADPLSDVGGIQFLTDLGTADLSSPLLLARVFP